MKAPIMVTPRISEKAYAQAQNNVYVFNVPLTANKQQIAEAVEAQFEVMFSELRNGTARTVRQTRVCV